ncbi:hypothetical protein [Granulicella tundricola]|uniref:Flagella basal body P-ring formation protein FlgA C-terminal domain-containing protein n=1 Tax=Granulicella tundricola (strain ATCC BAA-1859 / DSM 23138 / MP5ACTX9) TaxID=1198114 RepID=E8X3V5_GRATM|nr:hypothetical protein [Granulicella tundricola]ADW69383.1 hypothetical protein AciX9_2346 [Granulicella tundricola MP5ACTX9]
MKSVLVGLLVCSAGSCFGSELPRGCFRSVAEAVSQTVGAPLVASGGYRLADVRRDALRNKSWAMVESCGHPEQPAIAVEVAGSVLKGESAAGVAVGPVVMRAGATVRLVRLEANVRLEMPAVAQMNGALGERVRVRVVRSVGDFGGAGSEEQVLVGVVRGSDVLEME